jgi:alanine racemase
MDLHFSQLSSIAPGRIISITKDLPITEVITDSRKPILTEGSCFFAIKGERHDGHTFIETLYRAGVRQFVVERELSTVNLPDANIFLTHSALEVLQKTAAFHRSQFDLKIIGITGSNGKTIVKEWLHQLLSPGFVIVKNPGSYNSQLGVPLSILQIRSHHELGIFEAGISRPGEMEVLANIIRPTIGIFTNIGSSHDEGFRDRTEKVREKLKLFSGAQTLIYCSDHEEVDKEARATLKGTKLVGWGTHPRAGVRVSYSGNEVVITDDQGRSTFTLPLRESIHKENALHCILTMRHLNIAQAEIQSRLNSLKSVPMRLELKQGVNQCLLIDDTYNNDLAGLQLSLDFLSGQQKARKGLILSDILQSGLNPRDLVYEITKVLKPHALQRLIGIGPILSAHKDMFGFIPEKTFFADTEAFLQNFPETYFHDAAVLIKGARPFRFENIVYRLESKIHGTVMEVDLAAVVHNLNFFKSRLKPGVKLMVMVKAFAYGSGSEEVASLLQYHCVDYLGVAYADEGVALRRNHITLPIMVMNPSEESFNLLTENNLEPEIYSMRLLQSLIASLRGNPCKIHVKIDSGMHRLGFGEHDVDEMTGLLRQHREIEVISIFTHLAGSDESEHDAFTRQQAVTFEKLALRVSSSLGIRPLLHALNSPGILRFPDLQFNMVRLGIGLHGVDPTNEKHPGLQPVATLKTVISQIRHVDAGETIGYGRRGVANMPMKLATIAIGYADGFSRSNSRGVGEVVVNGKRASVVGNVCMDMTMIDITGIEAEEGDVVTIFGKELPITEVASRVNTIPYEILTNTSERVKRVFHTESF